VPRLPLDGRPFAEEQGLFGRRRQQQQREEARKEVERRALFEELAKRPDTICPFLGLAEARTEYRDRVSDSHRCYAFGDPAELSAEQQQKVCLQRGYGNCPRYLRGVLVIPTEELEALRRPQPAPPPPVAVQRRPTAPVAAAPARSGRGRLLVPVLAVLLLIGALGGAGFWYLRSQVASSAVAATLPAGTDMGAELVSLSPPGDGGQQLRATAFIGETEAVPNTTLIYVIDLSHTTLRGVGCGGDRNGDARADTPLDCELAAAAALNEQAIASGTVGEVGVVGFAEGGVTADLGQAAGVQALVPPGLDEDGDGKASVVEAIESAFSGGRGRPVGFRTFSEAATTTGFTAFSAGANAACELLEQTTTESRLVVFLSDGKNTSGEALSSVLPCATPAVFQTFAAGPDAACEEASELGSLQLIAELTEGTCTAVADISRLPRILEAVVEAQLLRVEISIDGGPAVDISEAAAPAVPRPGPATIDINHVIQALPQGDHRICLTVFGSDAGGPGSVTSCSPVSAAGGRLTIGD
jgi:hypothetical protein